MDIASGLTGFDYIVLTMIGLLGLLGLLRGFTQEVFSLAGWILAIIVVRFFHEDATIWLVPHVGGEASAAIVAFLALFFGTMILARIVASMAGGFARGGFLGPIDRILGLGFGTIKGVILASALFLLTQFATGLFDPNRSPPEWLLDSRSAPLLALTANTMVNWVQDIQREDSASSVPDAPAEEGGYSKEDREALDRLLQGGEGLDI